MIWVYAIHLPLVVFSVVFPLYVSKSAYFKYLYSLVLVVLLALFTFLVMPSAPPWYTGQAVNLLASTSKTEESEGIARPRCQKSSKVHWRSCSKESGS